MSSTYKISFNTPTLCHGETRANTAKKGLRAGNIYVMQIAVCRSTGSISVVHYRTKTTQFVLIHRHFHTRRNQGWQWQKGWLASHEYDVYPKSFSARFFTPALLDWYKTWLTALPTPGWRTRNGRYFLHWREKKCFDLVSVKGVQVDSRSLFFARGFHGIFRASDGKVYICAIRFMQDATIQLVGLSCERKGLRCEELQSLDVFRYWNGEIEAELSRWDIYGLWVWERGSKKLWLCLLRNFRWYFPCKTFVLLSLDGPWPSAIEVLK
jgi:hypothetical protein